MLPTTAATLGSEASKDLEWVTSAPVQHRQRISLRLLSINHKRDLSAVKVALLRLLACK